MENSLENLHLIELTEIDQKDVEISANALMEELILTKLVKNSRGGINFVSKNSQKELHFQISKISYLKKKKIFVLRLKCQNRKFCSGSATIYTDIEKIISKEKTPTDNISFKINGDEMAAFEPLSYFDFTNDKNHVENCSPKYNGEILANKQEFKGVVISVN